MTRFIRVISMAAILAVMGSIIASNALASGKSATAVKTASTSGDLYRFIPSGIDPINDVHATNQVLTYAQQNPAYGQALASLTGDTRFVASSYKADGYRPHAPAGSTNSAAGSGGQVVGVADHGNSSTVKVVAIINLHTMQVAYVMVRCGNLRLMRVTPIPWKPIHLGVTARINRMVSKQATITCPSGQKVTGFVTTRVKGVIYARTHGKVKGWAKIWLRQQADLQIRTTLKLKCGPAPKPPAPTPPGNCNITITNSVVNGNVNDCSTVTIVVICGNLSQTFTGSKDTAQQQANTWQQANCNQTPPPPPPPSVCPPGTTGTPPNCVAPPSNCVTITSMIDLNDVPMGKNSQQLPFTVNSCGAGSVTIDPGNGAISDCNSSTPLASITFNLVAGNNSFCVIYYAPNDPSATKGSITYAAIQGSAKDVKVDNFDITQSVRPTS